MFRTIVLNSDLSIYATLLGGGGGGIETLAPGGGVSIIRIH